MDQLARELKPQKAKQAALMVLDASDGSELWRVDPVDGTQTAFALQDPPANCNDVVSVGDSVYLTDRESDRIHRVDLASGTTEVWLTHPELTPSIIGNTRSRVTAPTPARGVNTDTTTELLCTRMVTMQPTTIATYPATTTTTSLQ